MNFNSDISVIILAAGYSTRMSGDFKALKQLAGQSFLERVAGAFKASGLGRILVVTGYNAEATAAEAERLGALPVFNPDFSSGMFGSVKAGLQGVLRLYPESRAVLLTPVDAALLLPRTIKAMLDLYAMQAGEGRPERIIIPSFMGLPGHPVLLPAEHFKPILAMPEDAGAVRPKGLRGYYHSIMPDLRLVTQGAPYGTMPDEYLNFLHPGADEPLPGSPKGRGAGQAAPEALASVSGSPVITAPLPDAGILSDLDTPEDAKTAEAFLVKTENRSLPSLGEAWQLLELARLAENKVRHSILVARGALRLGIKLMENDMLQNPQLLVTAGLLHDLLRMEGEHAVAAARYIESMGWPKTAFVVGCHTRLPAAYFERIGIENRDRKFKSVEIPEAAKRDPKLADELFYSAVCVYMADKYAMKDKIASIGERFSEIRQWFEHNQGAIEGIEEREKIVGRMEKWFSGLCGCTPVKTMATPCAHPFEAFLDQVEALHP